MSVNAAVLRYTVSKDRFGAGIGMIAMVVAAASTVGPAFAGIMLSLVSWQWLFAINLPLGVLTLALGWRSLPESHLSPQRFDWVSAGLSAVALGLVITLIDSLGHDLAWGVVAAQAVVCLGAFTLLVGRERHLTRPLLPLDLLRIPIFSLSLCTSVASFAAQLLAFVSLPFTFQTLMGFPTAQVGLLMMPWPAAIAIVAPLSGRLSDRFNAAVLGGVGLVLLALGLFALWMLPAHPTPLDISWRMALCGVGFGMFQAPNNRTMVGAAPKSRSGAASGLLSTARLTGQSIGAALVSLLLARLGIVGANWALLVAAGFAAVAAVISMTRTRF
jgi:DHA2 family multidrug resistance protein-like MFS transporter